MQLASAIVRKTINRLRLYPKDSECLQLAEQLEQQLIQQQRLYRRVARGEKASLTPQ